LLQERIVRELELERFGYLVDAKDPAFFSAFPDGRHFFMWQDERKTLDEIAKFSKRDAETFPAFEQHLEKLAQVVESLLLTTPPDFPPRGVGDFIDYIKAAARLRKLTRREIVGLVKIFTQSAADLLDEWFESPEVKVTLATDGVIGANGGPRSPGTAYILLHHCMGGVGGKRGLWGFVRGGMGAISEAIAQSARRHGAEIRVNAPVKKIVVSDNRARGVVLATGEEIDADMVASNLDPHATFLRLLEESDLEPEFRDSIRHFRTEGTSLKMNLALSGLPCIFARPSSTSRRPGTTPNTAGLPNVRCSR
jgi:phytoene dehydrogenase-like protein